MSLVNVTIDNAVGTIELNRPEKRNALKRDFIEEIAAAVAKMAGDTSVRVVVFKAQGTVFCAGMDLGEMQARAQSDDGPKEWQRDSEVYCDLLTAIYSLTVPTIACLQGPVLAGGVGMVLACDFIIAADSAFLSLPEPMRGITAAMVTPLLIHRVGAGPASHLLLSGRRLSVTDANTIGLCYEVVPADELGQAVDSLVQSIMQGSKSALAITKRHINHCGGANLVENIRHSVSVSAEARETDDAREGLAAFLEKRKPKWQP
jgi:methylglutaconyl-CoA hydratase